MDQTAGTPAQPTSTVLLMSGDLMFASRVRGPAEAAGHRFMFSGSLPAEPDDSLAFVILDLSTQGSKAATLVDQCQAICPQAKTIAFGPHVDVQLLRTAREAGFDLVMPRSQFVQSLGALFQ